MHGRYIAFSLAKNLQKADTGFASQKYCFYLKKCCKTTISKIVETFIMVKKMALCAGAVLQIAVLIII